MLIYRNCAALAFALSVSFGCRPPIPVPAGYEANVEVRDWAARVRAAGEESNFGITLGGYDPDELGLKEHKITLRGKRLFELAQILSSSCKRKGATGPDRPPLDGYGSKFSVSRGNGSIFMVWITLRDLQDMHGPEVAKHKEEIRKLLLDAYREQEAAKAAERERFPWKKE